MTRVSDTITTQTLDLSEIFLPIKPELEQVKQILEREMSSRYPCVDEMTRYGRRLGGKRLRPALLLLTAKTVDKIHASHLTLGTVVEMIHTATLVHDDVLDSASVRRYDETVNARWGNHQSILLGDFLFSHAFYLASTLDSTLACQVIGKATNRVCQGEIRQNDSCGKWELPEEDYLSMIDAKTAELCACSCRLGAHFAGADDEQTELWTAYGRCLGMAFQIIDDVLDLAGRETETGKSLGTDLAQAKPTLPLIHVWEQANESDRQSLKQLLASSDDPRAKLDPWLTRYDAMTYARSRAAAYAQQATQIASQAEPSDAQRVLSQLPEVLMHRVA